MLQDLTCESSANCNAEQTCTLQCLTLMVVQCEIGASVLLNLLQYLTKRTLHCLTLARYSAQQLARRSAYQLGRCGA